MEYKIKVNNKRQSGRFTALDESPAEKHGNENEFWTTYNIKTKENKLIQIHVEDNNFEEFKMDDIELSKILYECRKNGIEISIEQKEMKEYPDHIVIESDSEKHELKG